MSIRRCITFSIAMAIGIAAGCGTTGHGSWDLDERGFRAGLEIRTNPPTRDPPPQPPPATSQPAASQPAARGPLTGVRQGDPPKREGEVVIMPSHVSFYRINDPTSPYHGFWASDQPVAVTVTLPPDYKIYKEKFNVMSATTYPHPDDRRWQVLEVVGMPAPVFEYLKFNAGIERVRYVDEARNEYVFDEQYLLGQKIITP